MLEHFGFSCLGLIFLLLLFIPNMLWAGRKPLEYTAQNENKFLLFLERTGEVLTTIFTLTAKDLTLHNPPARLWQLIGAFVFMAMYELWWIRYFRSGRKLSDFYSSFWGIPLAGAVLPVISFILLSIYGRVLWLSAAGVILGIGHIGIHIQHARELKNG